MKRKLTGLAIAAAIVSPVALLNPAAVVAAESVEVLHWWTAGGEAAALRLLKENLEKQGVTWNDMPVAGGGGEAAMTALRARVTAGNPPTAVQLLGFDLTDWAKQGVLNSLNATAEKEGWAKLVPPAVQKFSVYQNNWVAVPVNIHTTNWVWANRSVLEKAGIKEPPKDWDGFIAAIQAVQKAGFIGLAHGGQPWQDGTVFEGVVLATGGADFYRKAFIDKDPKTLGSETMKLSFDRLGQLRALVDKDFSGRDWNVASGLVISGKAGFQIMGDWAKGEFVNAKQTAGKEFMCFRIPGTQGSVTFNTDQFALFKVGKEKEGAQAKLAKAIMDPAFQSAFNVTKGSAPARLDVSDAAFDACGKKAIADVKEAAAADRMLGSMAHGHAVPASAKQAFLDVITRHFNKQIDSAQAVKELAAAAEE